MSTANQTDKSVRASFCRDIQEKSHQNINLCYQCMKCAGGCPMNFIMDHNNYEILRMIQLGEKDKVLESNTPWFCISCKTCGARCPNGIETNKIFDTLKMEAVAAKKVPDSARHTSIFYDTFINSLKGFPVIGGEGRLYDLGLGGLYKLRTGTIFADQDFGKAMMQHGKVPLFPHNALKRRKGEIKKIFQRAKEKRS